MRGGRLIDELPPEPSAHARVAIAMPETRPATTTRHGSPPNDRKPHGGTRSRRQLLESGSLGLGGMALTALLQQESLANRPLPQHPPKATHVIFLHMVGAPSQLDLFDYKPTLQKHNGKPLPDQLWEGLRLAFLRQKPNLLGTQFSFHKYGQCGMELSELLPHLGQVADHITLVKSVHTEQFNHAPAQLLMQTGFARFGRPSLGSWISYGLGNQNDNLPTFVVMNTGSIAGAGNSLWGSGFLPTIHQGVQLRSRGDPVLFLSNPPGIDRQRRGSIVHTVNQLNRIQSAEVADPEIETRIRQYELAFRMQTSLPELVDTAAEPKWVHAMYGTEPGKPGFATNCLLARRMVERGVRFVQLYDQGWDHHSNLVRGLTRKTQQVDRPAAALVADLKQRGLLDSTLVIFGSEFGRTPMVQGDGGPSAGRDHHKDAFTFWLAGGGIQGGTTYGATDDLGFHAVNEKTHVNDLHATILHLLGLDHEQLTYKHQGRLFRLTDVGGRVVTPILSV